MRQTKLVSVELPLVATDAEFMLELGSKMSSMIIEFNRTQAEYLVLELMMKYSLNQSSSCLLLAMSN